MQHATHWVLGGLWNILYLRPTYNNPQKQLFSDININTKKTFKNSDQPIFKTICAIYKSTFDLAFTLNSGQTAKFISYLGLRCSHNVVIFLVWKGIRNEYAVFPHFLIHGRYGFVG